jgi:hypothetical protein
MPKLPRRGSGNQVQQELEMAIGVNGTAGIGAAGFERRRRGGNLDGLADTAGLHPQIGADAAIGGYRRGSDPRHKTKSSLSNSSKPRTWRDYRTGYGTDYRAERESRRD